MNEASRVCTRCIVDTTVPGVRFDRDGVCNFCHVHDLLEREYPLNDAGRRKLDTALARIKAAGRGRKYDCVTGISGGRDSTYTLYMLKKVFGLRPLAVHFNDGFGNPVAGENMKKAAGKLDVDFLTITSDWRESKDLKIAFLKASTPDMEEATDLGIATALYGAAAKERIPYVIIGQSFRTEGISPLVWNYLDGTYLRAVHERFGTVPLRPWKPDNPGFHLEMKHMIYYTMIRRIRVFPILYYMPYVRAEAEEIVKRELGWVYPGAHYFDDLYQALMCHVLRVKFGCDRRKINYSALIRSGQMPREEALSRIREVYAIEDPKIIALCLKRLGISEEEFKSFLALPPKTFRDYPNMYKWIRLLKYPIKIFSKLELIPGSSYAKYFECG